MFSIKIGIVINFKKLVLQASAVAKFCIIVANYISFGFKGYHQIIGIPPIQ
jgi:hypothetical protein